MNTYQKEQLQLAYNKVNELYTHIHEYTWEGCSKGGDILDIENQQVVGDYYEDRL